MVDGEDDGTSEIVRSLGFYAATAPVNRGQGAALRVGYKIASSKGASCLVTLDADGQYNLEEMGNLVKPIIEGTADFVQGSRRLSLGEPDDLIRFLGVYFFSKIITLLTGVKITDSSNGFRAIRSEVVNNITLSEDQYHASELLMGSIFNGYRVIERPASMKPRNHGTTKKGSNLYYGYNYARVILKTWFREKLLLKHNIIKNIYA